MIYDALFLLMEHVSEPMHRSGIAWILTRGPTEEELQEGWKARGAGHRAAWGPMWHERKSRDGTSVGKKGENKIWRHFENPLRTKLSWSLPWWMLVMQRVTSGITLTLKKSPVQNIWERRQVMKSTISGRSRSTGSTSWSECSDEGEPTQWVYRRWTWKIICCGYKWTSVLRL